MVNFTILAGTFTPFIRVLSFNSASNTLAFQSQWPAGDQPSWLGLHPVNQSVLYATSGGNPGQLQSFVIGSGGKLTRISITESGGADPAHLVALKNGKEVAVINYSGSTANVITLDKDLVHFTKPVSALTFNGTGPNAGRQEKAHPHQVIEHGDELLVPDLGADKIWRLAKRASKWETYGSIPQPKGSGPRHIVVQDSTRTIYTVHELDNTLTAQVLPAPNSSEPAKILASLSVLPPDVPRGSQNGAAELILSPTNKKFPKPFLYASNRNVSPDTTLLDPRGDTIAIFTPEPLKLVKHVYTGLNQIRGMAIGGPNNEYILAAGILGGGVVVYERINGGADLKELARLTKEGSDNVVSFVWL
ncbi:hypothetical protein BOTBODRAFT_38331 [Botryobasidium botryosum FD-172 SS1]|uniref:Isomerase YbhE n=1 Tax=Botryobasidium botryosum (strain FD-172 SS1) TaxID=930990 RepID=A0A067M8T9_BOTB1|nr:hypothetical protein BOTBODRAFT_38331 [Botryobasidium botryosum FD-172 SS1]